MTKAKKKKKFFDVEIPLIKKTTQIYGYSPEEMQGRIIKYDLTRFLKGKNALIGARVKLEGEKLTTTPKDFRIVQTFIKKIIRKRTDYIEDSFSTKCKDTQIKIKPLLIARRKVSRKVRKALRDKAKEELINYVKDKKTEEIFEDVLKNKLQKQLSLKLKRIYPLAVCEIRVLKVEKGESDSEKESS